MFYIYTPYISSSGNRIYHGKIFIYEAIPNTEPTNPLTTTIRKFELTSKGWKASKASGRVYYIGPDSINTASTVPLKGYRLLCFDSFNDAYTAKCILINRIQEVYRSMIAALTAKMNSIKSVTPELHYMSDAVPELFL